MKPPTPRERRLAALVLVLGALLAGFVFLLLPLKSEQRQLRSQLAAHRRQLAEAELLRRSLPELEKSAKEVQAQIDFLSRPNDNPTPEMVREIQQLTHESQVELSNIHPSEPEMLDTSTKYAASFEVRASLDRLVSLLYALEKSPHSLWVEGVEIGSDRGETSVLRTTITVAVYTSRAASKAGHAKS